MFVVELGALRVQTGHQIAQPFASGELRVHHAQEMAPSREVLDAAVRCEPIDQILEVTERGKVQQLRENRPSAIHGAASFARKTGNDAALQHSSRFQIARIELHAKTPAIAGSRKADINIYRTDVIARASCYPLFDY
jgi:hypothetical protein